MWLKLYYMSHQISRLDYFSSRLAFVFAPQLKPGVRSRMKMQLEQHRHSMLQLHQSASQIYCLQVTQWVSGLANTVRSPFFAVIFLCITRVRHLMHSSPVKARYGMSFVSANMTVVS